MIQKFVALWAHIGLGRAEERKMIVFEFKSSYLTGFIWKVFWVWNYR